MKIQVVNTGSGSSRLACFEIEPSVDDPVEPLWKIEVDANAPGQPPGRLDLIFRSGGREEKAGAVAAASGPAERVSALMERAEHEGGCEGVVHRVVHGGESFIRAVRLSDEVEAEIERLAAFAPLHNPANLEGIRAARRRLGEDVPQVAVFDTAFHHRLPLYAATYPGPREWREQGIRRYGFHGSSFRSAAMRAAALLGRRDDSAVSLILCHLGGGCSLCATIGGASIDTTMGFTPLDGIAMGTRSGELDPGILIHLMRQGMEADDLEDLLNRKSGLLGLSGISSDTRILQPEAEQGDSAARLAIGVFRHRLRGGIGRMLASLGCLPDALVFTDAMGETMPSIRAAACESFAFLGLRLDPAANEIGMPDSDIAAADSSIRVLVLRCREEWQMARECAELLAGTPEAPEGEG